MCDLCEAGGESERVGGEFKEGIVLDFDRVELDG